MELEAFAKGLLDPMILVTVASAAISLICSYVPGLSVIWAGLPSERKSVYMLGMITILVVGLWCFSYFGLVSVVPMSKEGLFLLFSTWIAALWTNATTYTYSPQTDKVKVAKALRNYQQNQETLGATDIKNE